MLSSGMLKEEVDAVLELLAHSKIEEARQKIQDLTTKVSSEYGRGALLALNGIVNAMTKSKGNDQILNQEKVQFTADRIAKVQMIDELDKGYLQTLTRWSKKGKTARTPENEPQA